MKIVSVIGARPHYIKHSVFSEELSRNSIDEIVINTGQHYDSNMSSDFLKEFNLQAPDYNLGIGSGSHARQTAEMMVRIESILIIESPDYVVVFGDTNTTLAGALVAAKLNIKLVHVESGIRSHNRNMPEEINRIIVDSIANILFAPTQEAANNIKDTNAFFTGDITYDNFKKQTLIKKEGKYYIATVHRPSNTDDINNLKSIFGAFDRLKYPVLLSVHPRIKKKINYIDSKNIKYIEPVGYNEMLNLMYNSEKVLTDSGGMQKEAYYMSKPCVTLRSDTEYPQTLIGNCNILVGNDTKKILNAIEIEVASDYDVSIFGDGNSVKKMVKIIIDDCK